MEKGKMPLKLPMFIECAPDDPTGGMVKTRQSLLIRIREGNLQKRWNGRNGTYQIGFEQMTASKKTGCAR